MHITKNYVGTDCETQSLDEDKCKTSQGLKIFRKTIGQFVGDSVQDNYEAESKTIHSPEELIGKTNTLSMIKVEQAEANLNEQ